MAQEEVVVQEIPAAPDELSSAASPRSSSNLNENRDLEYPFRRLRLMFILDSNLGNIVFPVRENGIAEMSVSLGKTQ